MSELFIFGCSGFAVECAQLAIRTGQFEISGFVEKDEFVSEDKVICINNSYKVPIIAESLFLDFIKKLKTKVCCVIAIANGDISNKIHSKFKDYCKFPNIIDPSAQLNDIKKIGIGNLIFQNVVLSWNVEMGNFNKFLFGTHIGHECNIGDFNEFNPKVSISGKCDIGGCNLFGVGSMIIQGKKVGTHNNIGMGAVLVRSIKSNETWFGNPAKKLIYE